MKSKILSKILFIFFFLVIVVGFSEQAVSEEEYIPQVGQAGKDVVWVPTPQVLADKMLEMAKVTPNDYVIDLGSGDGRIVITAAKLGARAHGIEYEHELVELSKRNAEKEGVADKVTFAEMDIFESDFSQATVITMFLLPALNLRLRPIILDLKPGTRVVSNSFGMEDWQPDETATVDEDCTQYCTAHLWIVPAKVGGVWEIQAGGLIEDLILEQTFQMITGYLESSNQSIPINGKLEGNKISFEAEDVEYVGSVNGNSMNGDFKGKSSGKWIATRIE